MSECDVVTVESVPLVATQFSCKREELPAKIPKALDPVWKFIKSKPELKFGFNVVVYWEGPKRVEAGVQVNGTFEVPAGLIRTQTPAGVAAHGIHMGPYSELGKTYDALHAWIAKNKLRMTGPFWEVYGHHNDDPKKLRTDIYFLVENP